jgi:hypothetical protein
MVLVSASYKRARLLPLAEEHVLGPTSYQAGQTSPAALSGPRFRPAWWLNWLLDADPVYF